MTGYKYNYAEIERSIEAQIDEINAENDTLVIRKKLKERLYSFENAFRKLPKRQRRELNAIKKATTAKMRWSALINHESALYGRTSALNLLFNVAKDGDLWIFPARNILILEFAVGDSVFVITIDGEFNELFVHVNRPPTLIQPAEIEAV